MPELASVPKCIVPEEAVGRLLQEEAVVKLFRPEGSGSTSARKGELDRIRDLAEDCAVQMQERVHTEHVTLEEVQGRFLDSRIPQEPVPLAKYVAALAPTFVRDSTRVACGRQIGHMTCSLPQYLPPLAELVTAMHQNVVKAETSKTVMMVEKQCMACLHRLIYARSDEFYQRALLDTEVTMGMFTSGGTVANITGLWVARNAALGPRGDFAGIEQCGLLSAAMHYGCTGAVVVGSALMHYSFKKATDVLGLGVQGLVTVPYDERYRVRIAEMERTLEELRARKVCVVAIVGVAGATETGSIDDLDALANLAERFGTHFHVDAAWGGPCLFSSELAPLLKGIERADSVTIDGHKQLFMPMGCGMLALRDPEKCKAVAKTASYIIRQGSLDLGKFTLEGSRPSTAVYMHANLACIGASGYETLMNRSARVCGYMAAQLRKDELFELVFEPMTNILLYRFVPLHLRRRMEAGSMDEEAWQELDDANAALQEQQKSDGLTFVSRTTVFDVRHNRRLVALRIVIGNPITEESDIDAVLADQRRIVAGEPAAAEEEPSRGQDDYWRGYWERMPEAARVFFLDDVHRFRASLVAPAEEPH